MQIQGSALYNDVHVSRDSFEAEELFPHHQKEHIVYQQGEHRANCPSHHNISWWIFEGLLVLLAVKVVNRDECGQVLVFQVVKVVNGEDYSNVENRHLSASIKLTVLGGSILEHHVGQQDAPAGLRVVPLQLSVRELVGDKSTADRHCQRRVGFSWVASFPGFKITECLCNHKKKHNIGVYDKGGLNIANKTIF